MLIINSYSDKFSSSIPIDPDQLGLSIYLPIRRSKNQNNKLLLHEKCIVDYAYWVYHRAPLLYLHGGPENSQKYKNILNAQFYVL
jgi:hypothetical protein